MILFFQSNYMGFGTEIVIDWIGIAKQNRGYSFSLEIGNHNKVGPPKKLLIQ